jgi:diacylglycerol O-acyltransferase / wax synthase
VPIDLREPGDTELGNRFGLLAVELPVGVADPIERLMTVRQRMSPLKSSYEPSTTLGLFAALGYIPKLVQDQMLDLLASRATAVMTNVPGPAESLTLAGSRIKQWVSWVPQSGDIGMGVSIASYAGHVQFGLMTDAALTPDPEALVSRFAEEFETYLYGVLLRSPSAAEGAKTVPSPARGKRDRDIAEPSGASASAPARPARSQKRPHGPRMPGGGDARKRSVKRLRRRA